MWDTLFGLTNGIALGAWAFLLFGRRTARMRAAILFIPIAVLCALYAVMLIGLTAGLFDPVGNAGGMSELVRNYSVDGLMALFQSRGGIVVGWTHYLAFDLMVGWWIAGDADSRGIPRWSQLGVLLATFLAGPLGLGLYLFYRSTRPEVANADD